MVIKVLDFEFKKTDFRNNPTHSTFEIRSFNWMNYSILNLLQKTKDTSAAEEMSTTFLHFNSFAIYVPISILLGIICVLFATCYLRDLYSQDKRYGGRKKRGMSAFIFLIYELL